jgi:hypothetical protein
MLQQITNNLSQYTGPTSFHLGSTMTMAVGAKLFVNASSTAHQVISDERHRREVTVEGRPRLLREIQLLLYLRGDGGDIGDHHVEMLTRIIRAFGLWYHS